MDLKKHKPKLYNYKNKWIYINKKHNNKPKTYYNHKIGNIGKLMIGNQNVTELYAMSRSSKFWLKLKIVKSGSLE